MKYIVGIDEVGRGPLAGPVAVGAIVATRSALRKFSKIKESKSLPCEKREEWFATIKSRVASSESRVKKLDYKVSFVSHTVIDKIGIVGAVRRAIRRSLKKLNCAPDECRVLLDGGLKAPAYFADQQTIIRGDKSETIIAMASVAAKVLRDRRMARLAKKYPEYGFEIHKGYGTKAHCEAIRKYGLCEIHRKTFCRKLLTS
jgi:ribonuclease HII